VDITSEGLFQLNFLFWSGYELIVSCGDIEVEFEPKPKPVSE